MALCKYCGQSTHKANKCKVKNQPNRQKCILCKGSHASASIKCPTIQKTREKIGIPLSKHEQHISKNKLQSGIIQVKPQPQYTKYSYIKSTFPTDNKKKSGHKSYAQVSSEIKPLPVNENGSQLVKDLLSHKKKFQT